MERIRELTFDERATWGECSVCGAKDGEKCDPDKGVMLGQFLSGARPEGAHIARLNKAPTRVRIVPEVG